MSDRGTSTAEVNGEPSISAQPFELRLHAPFRFDQSIGYWTGEPDLEQMDRTLRLVPVVPDVERVAAGGELRLRGPRDAVQEHARQLRAAGLR